MLLVVTANNIIMMWVAVEATTLGSAFLVGIYGHRSSLEAAWKYVMICTVGVAFGLYGTILVYSDAVNFLTRTRRSRPVDGDREECTGTRPDAVEDGVCFCTDRIWHKGRYFPDACLAAGCASEAPSPVSALLSGVLLNCALFVVIRFSIILDYGVGPELPRPSS